MDLSSFSQLTPTNTTSQRAGDLSCTGNAQCTIGLSTIVLARSPHFGCASSGALGPPAWAAVVSNSVSIREAAWLARPARIQGEHGSPVRSHELTNDELWVEYLLEAMGMSR
jgi:hypothetical protein